MNPIHGNSIYDPMFHTYVDIRSARGQRLYATYAHLLDRHAAARHTKKRNSTSRNETSRTERDPKKR